MTGDRLDTIGNATLREIVAYQSRARGTQNFIVHEDDAGNVAELSYAELDLATNALGNYLLSVGLQHGDRVLIAMRNSIPFVITMLGCAKAGFVAVPVNTGSVTPEVRHIVELVDPAAFFTEAAFAERVLEVAEGRQCIMVGCVARRSRPLQLGRGNCCVNVADHNAARRRRRPAADYDVGYDRAAEGRHANAR